MQYCDQSAQTRFPMSKITYTSARGALLGVALAATLIRVTPAAELDAALDAIDSKVISWRRDFHQNPELSNREARTSKIVADHLRKLGMSVETGIAMHGVVGLLKTGRPGPTIALRADMDALPVTEASAIQRLSRP